MSPYDWVLESKSDATLHVKLTFTKRGQSKGAGRAGWEFTDNFDDAAIFKSHDEIADALKKHRVPLPILKVRPLTNCFYEWQERRRNLSLETSSL